MSLIPHPKYVVKVSVNDGRLTPHSPLTIKNQIRPILTNTIASIEDILDVSPIDVVTGATIIYNSVTDKYEIKQEPILLDFGEF